MTGLRLDLATRERLSSVVTPPSLIDDREHV
jgi:hypothetical protein